MRLHEAQGAIAGALLDPSRPIPDGIVCADGLVSPRRFGVYRNNVTVSLINALRDTFPATERLMGADAFRDVARLFARSSPPASPVMLEYGAGFPEFLESFEPLKQHPYFGDVARLERARLQAYHAADAAPIDPGLLAGLAPEDIGELGFVAHPAVGIVPSRYPIVTIWSMNSGLLEPGRVDFTRHENALVTRADMTVEIRRLRPGAAAFTRALFAGRPLSDAAEAGLAASAEFDLGAALGDLLAAGAFQAVQGRQKAMP